MLYMIERRGPHDRWEAIGTGDGERIEDALEDLEGYGGELPAGEYRYLPSDGLDVQLVRITVDSDGAIRDSSLLPDGAPLPGS